MTLPKIAMASDLADDEKDFFGECAYNMEMTADIVMRTRVLNIEDDHKRSIFFSIFINRLIQTAAELTVAMSPPGAATDHGRASFRDMAEKQFEAAILNHNTPETRQ